MATVATADLITFLDDLLQPSEFDDYGPNGLQVPGREHVETVVTGVSAGSELFERATDAGADLVLVHHGLLWQGPPRPLDRPAKRRLQLLFDADIALAAYHLPLDAHLEHGNNALLAAAIGATVTGPLAGIGVSAAFPAPISAAVLRDRVRSACDGREPLTVSGGPDSVATIGIVSGGGQGYLGEAIAAGLDAFVTGEASERNFNEAREAGIHFLSAGHYATETFGVRRLGELLHDAFGVRHTFVDVPNPI
ncbi:MAG TPA: Nif3-like dinuclear metal center hexameric protein [Solirubrobacteraceae bacterium]|nr:Nif3-like dinuclear metal center hexameric protein [Solirubrobacteraceae bacterium]